LVSHFYHQLTDQLPTGAEWGCGEILEPLQWMKTGSLSKQASNLEWKNSFSSQLREKKDYETCMIILLSI